MRLSLVIVALCIIVCTAAYLAAPAEAGIAAGGAVVKLTAQNFKEKVYNSDQVWMVAFVAPWCGHCQKLAPEWAKAAESMKGIVLFGAVNCDEEKEMASQFGIQGFPTIKVFGTGKKTGPSSASDYQGQRTASAIAGHAAGLVPNHVKRLKKTADAGTFFGTEKPKAVLFTNKTTTPLLFKSLAHDFKKVMDFAEIRNTDTELVTKYAGENVNFPLVKVFDGAIPADGNFTGHTYDGKIDKVKLGLWLTGFVNMNSNAEHVAEASGEAKKSAAAGIKKKAKDDVPEDYTAVSSVDELRAAADKASNSSKVLAFFLVPSDEAREEVHEVAKTYRKDPIAFAAASLSSPLGELWNTKAGAPAISSTTESRALLVKPKRSRVAFVHDLAPTDGDEEGSAFSEDAAHAALDRAIGGDLQYKAIRLGDDSKDWIDGLLSPPAASSDHDEL